MRAKVSYVYFCCSRADKFVRTKLSGHAASDLELIARGQPLQCQGPAHGVIRLLLQRLKLGRDVGGLGGLGVGDVDRETGLAAQVTQLFDQAGG